MKKIYILLFLTLVINHNLFSISSPKQGIIMPSHVKEFFKQVQTTYSEGYYASKFEERRMIQEKISQGILPKSYLTTDTILALVLLGRYADSSPRYTRQQFQQQLFDGPNPTGTVTEYFKEVSYDQMYFTGYCTDWYAVPGTMSSYVGNDNGLSVNGGPRFTLDLIKASDSTLNFANFIQYYDSQNNPRIGFVGVVHTGAGAEAGAYNIWSHRWNFRMLTGGQPYQTNDIDPKTGKFVLIDGDYAIQPELAGNNNQMGDLIEIGVFTHEFGHIFGLPDLYDTDNSSEGLGNWCLMAGGSWGGNGNTPHTPVHMSAWCKKQMGWLTPINVTTFIQDLLIPNVEENPVVYRLWRNSQITNEYFLIENRQKIKFDKYLYNNGLLIYHVDDSRPNNRDENHYKVGLIQADGLWDLNKNRNRGDAGDPYPGSTNNSRFDAASNPNSNSHSKTPTYVSVRNIRLSGQFVTADLDIGTQPYVIAKQILLNEASPIKNERIEPGEFATANITLYNVEQVSSPNTSINLLIDEPDIQLLNFSKQVSISDTSEINVSLDSAFIVNSNFQSRYIYVKYRITTGVNVFQDSLKILIGIPKILLYSRAEKPSLSNYYFDALNYLNKSFEYVNIDTPKYLYGRDVIVIFTGKNKDTLFSTSFLDSLRSYISSGKHIFMSGQNIAEFLNTADLDFLNNQLGINYLRNASIFTNRVYGRATDYFGKDITTLRINGTDGAANETSMDIIESRGNFNVSLTFKADGTDATGGWRVFPSGAKLFFLGFGFESINDSLSSLKRNNLFSIIYNWFMNPTSVNLDVFILANNFHLDQNYPNPFNAQTRIAFSIPEKSFVNLSVFNSLGEEVKNLLSQELDKGNYSLDFEAKDLPSGIYLYRLSTNKYTSTKKMLLIK